MTDVEARPEGVPADPAPTSPAPGPRSLRLHRLIALVTAVTALVAGVFITPTVRAAVRTADRPELWAMLLFLLLPPLVAGCAAAIGTADPPRRSGPDDARGTAPPPCARSAVSGTADRVWRTSLLALVVGYAILVLLAARFPLLPPVESSDVAPLPNPLTNYFLTIAVAATAVLPDRVRFAHVTALAIPLAGTYPVDAGYSSRILVEEVLIYLTSDLGNMGVLTWLLHQTGILDEADARRRDLVIRLRTDESRSRARRAGDDFIHDHVLPVLKSVPTAPTGSPRLRRSAHEALTSLSGVPGPQRAPACPASELLGTLTPRLRGIGDDVVASGSIERDLLIPRDVARAVVDAAAEAVRNSLAHAAPPSRRGTVTRTAARMLEAELRDDRRARFFTGTAVVRAARRTRTRGLEVILLDDRGGAEEMSEHVRRRAVSRAVQALDGALEGCVVIRLLPRQQRPNLMSIVTQEDTCLLGPDGEPITPP